MKKAFLVLVTFLGAIGMASPAQVNPTAERKHVMIALPEGPNVDLSAIAIHRQEPALNVVRLIGSVEIKTKDMLLRADEADYNDNTGEIVARGTVRIKLETQR